MTQSDGQPRPPLDYATPQAESPLAPWGAGHRLGLAVLLSVVHWFTGLGAVAIALSFETRATLTLTAAAFLFPVGWAVMWVAPHAMAVAAIANSVCWGFVLAYVIAHRVNRRRAGRAD